MPDHKPYKIDPDQSWQVAAAALKDTIHFSSSFTSTIRSLQQNKLENLENNFEPSNLNDICRFSVMRLCKASSIKAPLYYLTCTFKSDEIADKKYLSTEDLVSLYTIDELSAVIALSYVYNSLRKACDKEEWQKQAKFVNECLEIGGYLGKSLPDAGLASGLLLTGMRCLAPSIFLSKNIKAFKNYRRDMKIKKVAFDLQMEYELFGCTHLDIATQLIQNIGYGVEMSSDFYKSLLTLPNKPLEKKPNIMRIMLLWVEALYTGKKPPVINGENEVSMADDVLDQLMLVTKQIQESGSAFSWLSKGKSSITKQLAPVLYNTKGAKKDSAEDASDQEQISA